MGTVVTGYALTFVYIYICTHMHGYVMPSNSLRSKVFCLDDGRGYRGTCQKVVVQSWQ